MKILHCADIHLDSPMSTYLSTDKARIRKQELLQAFLDMVEDADGRAVRVVLLAGDLFDSNRISSGTKKAVLDCIRSHENMEWFYLKGNHDRNDFLQETDEVPGNLHCFSETFGGYAVGNRITVCGVEMTKENPDFYRDIRLNQEKFNIVMLHGQEAASDGKNDAEIINLNRLRNLNIDYLALGHVHAYKEEMLDSRARYCYPGCLESRGFDECFRHGYVILDVNEETGLYTTELVERPIRKAYAVTADITGLHETVEITDLIEQSVIGSGARERDIVKVELTGEVDYDCEKNLSYLDSRFSDNYFAFRLKDLTKLHVDYMSYMNDKSLKGEFVRTVQAAEDLTDEEKAMVIRYGMRALMKDSFS